MLSWDSAGTLPHPLIHPNCLAKTPLLNIRDSLNTGTGGRGGYSQSMTSCAICLVHVSVYSPLTPCTPPLADLQALSYRRAGLYVCVWNVPGDTRASVHPAL